MDCGIPRNGPMLLLLLLKRITIGLFNLAFTRRSRFGFRFGDETGRSTPKRDYVSALNPTVLYSDTTTRLTSSLEKKMNISSIPEDMSIKPGAANGHSQNGNNATADGGKRSRAYSHTRTNSSSSSASSHVQSPTNAPTLAKPNAPFGSSPPGSGGETSDGSTSSSYIHPQYTVSTASEAAAVAALRSNVNNVQISSTNRPPLEDSPQLSQHHWSHHYPSQPQAPHQSPVHHGSGGGGGGQNKLSNVAVSAAAFASKPKESALSKAKMFARQAKPHLSGSSSHQSLSHSKRKAVDLTIQTKQLPPSRPSLSERSPLSRPSKELDRIASLAPSTTRDSEAGVPGGSGKQHKHHMPFRSRKDSHGGVVLSSSSSNSKLISEQGSIYSFHPSSPGVPALEVRNLGSKEDRDQVAEDSWALLCSKVMPLFSGEGLRVPVEDLNNLVVMHLDLLIKQGVGPKEVLNEFRNFLRIGILNMDQGLSRVSDDKLIGKLVETWMFFFSQVLPYLEAVFLPLQLELEGTGQILSLADAKEYWSSLLEKQENLTIRRYILIAFRDHLVIPLSPRLQELTTRMNLDFGGTEFTGTAARILQCTNILSAIQSGDENQVKIDTLVKALKSSWFTMPRTAKDRRGFVLNKSNSIRSNPT
jgi:hypothetical protein